MVEPIAIVGLGCRLPGGATTPEKLWDVVAQNTQCWADVPPSRYNWEAFHHPDPDARGTHNARGGFFLDGDLSRFDAGFFGISAAEAAALDPQQRLLLEVSYEALENAGMTLESLRGSSTGVYVALVSRDYDRQIYKDPAQIPKHHLTGCGDATACGRLAYVFDLRGPCLSLDTGCSGGLVALHLACQALRLGETDAAIVGGTNLLLGPDMTIAMSALHMINDNGRCYPFDSRGAGYGRAEGVAALVLKRLSDAERDGDAIRAVIRHTGVNQDGRTNGILLPSAESQQQLTATLYEQAGLDPHDVCYVEAHGTGTQAGDAAEVRSISRVFAERERERPLFLGSVKANLGHSESTSGLAGVIKTVLALEKGVIPPVAELEEVKPDLLPLLQNNILIPREPRPWPHDGPRLASVNSFGFGGTNAHVILQSSPGIVQGVKEEPPAGQDSASNASSSPRCLTPSEDDDPLDTLPVEKLTPCPETLETPETPHLFIISAKSKASLEGVISNLQNWTAQGTSDATRHALAQTLSTRRSRFNWRSSIVASSQEALVQALSNAKITKCTPSRLVFLFTGQGAQYPGMGRALLRLSTETPFAQSLNKSQAILTELGASWNLVDEILQEPAESRINSSELSQPATTAIQIALVDFLASSRVTPAAVLGHSSGEVAAAYAAGILGHREAITIAYHKGFVAGWCKDAVASGELSSRGAMLAVGLGETDALGYLQQAQGTQQCVVACVNSPSSVTLSGDEDAVSRVQTLLDRDGVFNRRLRVDIAYHSHHMRAVSERFHREIEGITPQKPKESARFFSSVTGEEFLDSGDSGLGAGYWVDNLVSQVRFSPALEQLAREHFASSSDSLTLVEIGPHAALQGPIRQIMAAASSSGRWSYTPTLLRDRDAHEAVLETLGSLFELGVPLSLPEEKHNQPLTNIPPYPWDHSIPHWHESRLSKEYRFRPHAPHDLLGLRLTGTSTIEPVFRHLLSVDDLPWLQEHIIDGFALYPGSAFLCMAIEALRQVTLDRGETRPISKYVFRGVSFSKALVVPDSPGVVEVLISLCPSRQANERLDLTWEEFRVTSVAADGSWNEHCRGLVRGELATGTLVQDAVTAEKQELLEEMKGKCTEPISTEQIYAEMRANGIDYGDSFSILQSLVLGDHQAVGTVRIPDIRQLMPSHHMQPHVVHPAVFDAFMHIVLPLYHRHCSQGPVMLVSVGEVSVSADIVHAPGEELVVACRLTQASRRHGSVEVSVFQTGANGEMNEVLSLSREDFRAIGEGVPEVSLPDPCYHIDWIPVEWTPVDSTLGTSHGRIKISAETPLTVSLGDDLLAHMASGESAVVPWSAESMDPEAVHIYIGDSVIPLPGLKSLLWVRLPDSIRNDSISTQIDGLTVILDVQEVDANLLPTITEIVQRSFIDQNPDAIDLQYRYTQGQLLIPRLALNASTDWLAARAKGDMEELAPFHTSHPLQLHFKKPGLLDSAVFIPSEATSELSSTQLSIQVYAHAVNQTDVAIALGRADPAETMAGEFAGVVLAVGSACQGFQPGDRVCGWGAMPYTNLARVEHHLVHRIENDISMVEAASIPLAFQTAAHALTNIANLTQGQSVLIHGAAGGVGQAAISIAQYLGADVYATASTAEKQYLLTNKGLPESHIFSSLSTSFQDGILRQTGNKGVDVVLNCSSSEILEESLPCLADFGYLIDVTKSIRPLALESSRGKNITVATVDMRLLASKRPEMLQQVFARVMQWYHAGVLSPITSPTPVMSLANLSQAFRLVQSQRYAGKIVLEAGDAVEVPQLAQQRSLDGEGGYVVVGGDEALNGALCAFLEERGAGHILSIQAEGNETDALSNSEWPIRGVFYVETESTTIKAKNRTSVSQAIKDLEVDFCITLRSFDGHLRTQDLILANRMTLYLGIKPSTTHLYTLLEYCLSPAARQGPSELFSLDWTSFPGNLLFSALPNMDEPNQPDPKRIDQQIAAASSLDDIHRIVTAAAIQQLASFLALDPDDIQESAAVASVGLDSLLAIEFKNWVVRTLQAPMQTSEILDALSLTQLVKLIVQRSKLVKDSLPGDSPERLPDPKDTRASSPSSVASIPTATTPTTVDEDTTLPPLPIPDLHALVERHLSYLRAFATEDEFQTTLQLATDFQAPNSLGRALYDRLVGIKTASPETWYHDLYLQNQYLVRNGPLAPYMNFFFTHPVAPVGQPQPHSQAQRAALVAATVISYKSRLEKGQIQPRYVNEQPLCMDLYRYLFNASREPRVGVDVMRQYPGNDYFVVFRRGHVFKVPFEQEWQQEQEERLVAVFQAILDTELGEVDWLGMLTADDRISWARNRSALMALSAENTRYIDTIEQSAFVLCLDDGSPETADERGRHFHFGDGANRWHDKPIEYIVAANGVSGVLGDHTGLDAGTVHDLNTEIAARIRQEIIPKVEEEAKQVNLDQVKEKVEQIPHTPLTADMTSRIQSVQSSYNAAVAAREHRYPTPLPYGSSFMRHHKVPANSGFQLVVQLAARLYFGHTQPCWETVLQSNFRTGRVEINQVVSTQVAAFIDAAADDTVSVSECRKLLLDAARTHSSAVLACTRAGGSDRFLSMLREIVDENEEEPGLYHDPVYKRVRPRKLISNCFATGMAENGCTLRDEEGVWLHFEVEADRVKFSILGPAGDTLRFCDDLVRAAERVRRILDLE